MNMDNTKSIFVSRTVISAIVVLVAAVINLFGYNIDAKNQTELIELIMTIITAVGALITIYFRIIATKKLR